MLAHKEGEIRQCVEKFLGGKENSFDSLVRLIASDVVNIACYYVGNIEDAKDIAQEVLIKLYRKLKGFRQEANISTWIYRIVINTSIDFIRRKRKVISFKEGITKDRKATQNIKDEIVRRDKKVLIEEALERLPSRQKEVIIFKHFEGLKINEISKVLGCSESSVKTYLYRAVENLKKIIGGKNALYI